MERHVAQREARPIASSYRQRDGKTVTIDANGKAKRFLASGEEDFEPLAGLAPVKERLWLELIERALANQPLTVADISHACPTQEAVAEF